MRHCLGIVLAMALGGCGSFDTTAQLKAFHPYAMKPDATPFNLNDPQSDASGYEKDASRCYFVALGLDEHLDPERIGSQAVRAAGGSAGSAAINPMILPAAAAGAAFAETIRGLGLDADDKKFVFALCLADQAKRRGTYVVVDPALKGAPQ